MKIILIILSLLFVYSCTYEEDLFESTKQAPTFYFIYNEKEFEGVTDSLKIPAVEIGKKTISFDAVVSDKSSSLALTSEFIQGSGVLKVNGDTLKQNGNVHLGKGKFPFLFTPTRSGKHIIDLYISDLYGKSVKRRVEFTVFTNLNPVANLSINQIRQNSTYEIEIDGSGSFDMDEKWGGKIQEYIFKIGSYYEFRTTEFASIKHILPGPGSYVISLQVVDNDGGVSQPVFDEIQM
jgi:hypothetical protein